jgi:hypothetical protein
MTGASRCRLTHTGDGPAQKPARSLPAVRGGIAGEAGRTRRAHEFSGSQPLAAIALPAEFPPQPRTLTARRDIRQGEPL